MRDITTTFEHVGHWIRMRQSPARFSGLEPLPRIRCLADFITTTSGFGSFGTHRGQVSTWQACLRECRYDPSRRRVRRFRRRARVIQNADTRLLDRYVQSSKMVHAALLLSDA